MGETVEQKARRYLGEGRLVVERVVTDEIRARCRGGGAVYELGLEAGEITIARAQSLVVDSAAASVALARWSSRPRQWEPPLGPALDVAPTPDPDPSAEQRRRLGEVIAGGVPLRRHLGDAESLGDLGDADEVLGSHIEEAYCRCRMGSHFVLWAWYH